MERFGVAEGWDMRTVYGNMSVSDRARLRADCAGNQDPRYDDLCASVGAM